LPEKNKLKGMKSLKGVKPTFVLKEQIFGAVLKQALFMPFTLFTRFRTFFLSEH
jgi:hypothetical protein